MFIRLAVILAALGLDQATKYWINTRIAAGSVWAFGEYFNVVKVFNSGVSFSMFSNHGDLGAVMLTVAALVICGFLLRWMFKETHRAKVVSLGLIVGGALGNVIDRVRFGAVIDFLDFHYQNHHWPAFNLADTFICIGAAVLIYMEITRHTKGEKTQ